MNAECKDKNGEDRAWMQVVESSLDPRLGHARRAHLLPMALIVDLLKYSDVLGMNLPTSAQWTLGIGPERQEEKSVW